MRGPPPPMVLLFALLVLALLGLVQLGLISIAFEKLDLSPASAFLLLATSLLGSSINLPVFSLSSSVPPAHSPFERGWWLAPPRNDGRTLVAVNVGGGLVPLLFSAYLLGHHPLPPLEVLITVLGVGAISYAFSRPIPRLGIGMPVFVAPLSAALLALLIAPEQSAPLAYIGGTLGVLLGADLLRLKDIRHLGAPLAAIGGAGTFDGIFVTGIVAVLLA